MQKIHTVVMAKLQIIIIYSNSLKCIVTCNDKYVINPCIEEWEFFKKERAM